MIKKFFAAAFIIISITCTACFVTACAGEPESEPEYTYDPNVNDDSDNDDTDIDDGKDADGGNGATGEETHKHTAVHTSANSPDCITDGNIEYWYCPGCGKYFADEALTEEISADKLKIEKTGHTPVPVAGEEATCQKTGMTEGSRCGVCGEVLKEREETGLGNHNFIDKICEYCGRREESSGLQIENNIVTGMGSCTDKIIVIPADVEGIADYVFEGQEIEELYIIGGVKEIGEGAFNGCTKLTKIYIGDSVEKIGESAFAGCETLTEVNLPSKIKEISSAAFYASGLREIKIPEGVETICATAFENCRQLESVEIPDSVQTIEMWAFAFCTELQEIIFCGTEEEWSNRDINPRFNQGVPSTCLIKYTVDAQ